MYRFYDAKDRVIYVGKAKSLRPRLSSYFQDISALHQRTASMVTTAARVDWVVVKTEVEALQLEYSWIKEFDPRFNVRYRDDKSYPSLAVTLHEQYPRLMVMRGPRKPGVRYFGPYSHAWAIRETLDLVLRVFPARTCSNGVFKRAAQVGRPCLLGYIDKCSAPCVDRISAEGHRAIVDDFCDFMAGRTEGMMRRIDKEMQQASAAQEYELAARLRDNLAALQRAMEKQAVVFGDGTDADVVGLIEDTLEASIQVFHVRGGRIRGQRGWIVDKVEDVTTGDLIEQLVLQVYGGDLDVPREVLVPVLPPDHVALTELLAETRGTNVSLRVPKRGDKRALMETVQRNAAQALAQHRLKRASDLTSRSKALAEIQESLGLEEAPLRIECFDISTLQGQDTVASMVVFEDGLARRQEYRRFAIHSTDPELNRDAGDVAAMHEVITRRFSRYLEALAAPALTEALADAEDGSEARRKKFAYPPNLVVVDGGAPQVAAAQSALEQLGVTDVAVCGLAKRLEEVWLPATPDPVILPRSSEALYLLQRVRDEAHRFAISYHREKRGKRSLTSALDDIPGLGEVRRKALLATFGTLAKLRRATVEEIGAVAGIGPQTATAVHQSLAREGSPAGVAIDMTTGEVMDPYPDVAASPGVGSS